MPGQYSVEDLLKLRASPLICRPATLPLIEEWMGAQEPSNRRPVTRGKQDESAVQNEPFQKRPTLLDNQRRTSADPDRIVLGPPRRSFASSNARAPGKLQEASEESTNNKTSLQEKARNGDWSESRHHDRKGTETNGRYSSRQESEEPEHEGRRDYERKPKWSGRERQDQALEENDDPTRTSHSRAKLSQSWFKKDTGDAQEESRRDNDKFQEWRRDRGRDRDWDRSAKAEADPEWMDATGPEEQLQAQAHTQEEFQRWRERMKAEATGAATTVPATNATENVPKKLASPEPDDSMDKFFAKFESKAPEQKSSTVKIHGKTRFASLFGPQVEQNKPTEAAPPMPSTERPSSAQLSGSTVDADQAGFARILEMLQTRGSNPIPQSQEPAKPRTPLYARGNDSKVEPEARPPSQNLISLLTGQSSPQHQESAQYHPRAHQEKYAGATSPIELPTHTRQQSSINKDEVLLNLLRQANLAPKPQPLPPPQQSERGRPGGFGMFVDPEARAQPPRNQMISPGEGPDPMMIQRRETGRLMFDDSPGSMFQNEPREQLTRRPTNGPPPGYADDPTMMHRGQNPQQRPMQPPQPPQGLPPGFQRPPGLDQLPRPPNSSWPPQQPQPQQQPPRQPPLPPGLSNLPRGMLGPPFGQPQQAPSMQNPYPQQHRSQPPPQPPPLPRKYTGESSSTPGMPNLPPGMYPPPGFINAGPPPGFPGSMANHPSRYQGEPGPPQGINSAFMEMYGEVGGRGVGLRGGSGNGGMPPFR